MPLSSAGRALLAVAATAAALTGCAAPEPELVVGVASSLEPSLRAFADAFEVEAIASTRKKTSRRIRSSS